MHITKVVIENYRCLRNANVPLDQHLNIVVGDNECGKSTLLEAVNLALTGQLNGRPIASEIHPYMFNSQAVAEFIAGIRAGKSTPPRSIFIEIYVADDNALASLKGTNNSLRENVPGVRMAIAFNEDYKPEYATYIADRNAVRAVPVEFYEAKCYGFSGNLVSARGIPIKPSLIDASTIRNNAAANRYVLDLVRDGLTSKQKIDLALSYRLMKDKFLEDNKVAEINTSLAEKKGGISDKQLTISLDTTSRASWETGVMPHLADIPMPLVGKANKIASRSNWPWRMLIRLTCSSSRSLRTIFLIPT